MTNLELRSEFYKHGDDVNRERTRERLKKIREIGVRTCI
jgi:hypothetical protein